MGRLDPFSIFSTFSKTVTGIIQGSLVLEQIEDYVDVENKAAWLSFNFQGQKIKLDCKVEDDWVDTDIFLKFIELLAKADPSKIYIYYDLGGQDCIIGCVTKTELEKLNGHGIKFVPLT